MNCGARAWPPSLRPSREPNHAIAIDCVSFSRIGEVDMPLYRVLRYHEDTRTISEHLNVDAKNALAAALVVCAGPLVPSGPLELFQAYVTLMNNATEFAFFFAPLGSFGTFGKRIPRRS
jgi:hypothetical protein